MHCIDLGRIRFAEADALQRERLEAVAAGAEETLYLLEHEPVITLGRNGKRDNLHVSEEFLRAQGIDLARAGRGGDITCHFPGQLVAYPVFRLERRVGGIRAFFHDMEEAAIAVLAEFGVTGTRSEGRPGVWVGERKIASVGIGVRKWVSFNGLALNVAEDVSLFRCITLCGLPDVAPTSLNAERKQLGLLPVSLPEVKDVCAKAFERTFAPA